MRLFSYFESRVPAYPANPPGQPPGAFWAFLWHYARPLAPWLLAMSLVAAAFAALEIVLLGYLGTLIDRMSDLGPERFLAMEGGRLALMGTLLLIVLPALSVIGALIMYQALMGNFPQRVRWMGHRWLIGQSMHYFSGRIRRPDCHAADCRPALPCARRS